MVYNYQEGTINMNITKQYLQDYSIDAVWLHKTVNVRYQTGFTGEDTDALITPGSRHLITDARYTEQARKECPNWEVYNHGGHLIAELQRQCEKHKIQRLGVELSAVSAAQYLAFRKAVPDVEVIEIDADQLRQVKTEEEIHAIQQACSIADRALHEILSIIRVGQTENELRIALERAMLAHGSEKTSFSTIVASGYRSAMPHGIASDKVVQDGEFITFDFGAVYHGYHSDMTRTFVVGRESPEQRRIYNAVLQAQQLACDSIRPGMQGSEPDELVRSMLEKHKLATYFTHSLGHSLGLEIHEGPTLSPRETRTLETGMVVTVEPGVYIPDFGGVRIEDTTVVRENGLQLLTQFSKNLVEL